MGDNFVNVPQLGTNQNGQAGPSGQQQPQQPPPPKMDRNDLQNHVHASLSQIVNLTRRQEGFVLHRQKVHYITAIGVLMSLTEGPLKNVYLIDDYTKGGPVEVTLWKNDEIKGVCPPEVVPEVKVNEYMRVTGEVRYDEVKPFIVAYEVGPIRDPRVVDTHFLEVIHDSLLLEKRMKHTLATMGENGQNPA